MIKRRRRGGDVSRSSVTVGYGSEAGPGKRTTTVDRDTPGVPGEAPQDEDTVFVTLGTGTSTATDTRTWWPVLPAGTCAASPARSR
ncbi:hypothetical protein GCM10010216_65640 [Streptomyces flaveolus]|nr:hypothetical protein GCM10010216_65640 [Streptomyces flaveolus]